MHSDFNLNQMKLKCINCDNLLVRVTNSYMCENCSTSYAINDGKAIMKNEENQFAINVKDLDWLSSIKALIKKNSVLYNFLVLLFSPVCFNKYQLRKQINNNIPDDGIVLNIGSGNARLRDNIINLDCFPYENVDIVADACNLPFPDNSVDAVVNMVVLEHINRPDLAISEIYRVLRDGGVIFSIAPFIAGFHASPEDYHRWTKEGLQLLHKRFKKCEDGISGGPTSAMLWIFQEWLALCLSCGIIPLYKLFYILISLVTWPIKFLDYLLIYHPMSVNIASSFYYIGKKQSNI